MLMAESRLAKPSDDVSVDGVAVAVAVAVV